MNNEPKSLGQRAVDAMPWLDTLAGKIQTPVQNAVNRGGTAERNLLDGRWLGAPLHPVLTDVPVGAWSAAAVFDALDLAADSRALRNAADASLALGLAGGVLAAATGLSDWRYLSGGSRRMGLAHGLLNVAGMALNGASLGLRLAGRRGSGKLALLAGYGLTGMSAHLGGELTYKYGLRVNRNVFEKPGPDEFVAVMAEDELPAGDMRRVEAGGAGILISRATDGEVYAIAATCNHFSGPLQDGERRGDRVICPWHWSCFDLRNGEVLEGPAVFPQSRYEVRLRDGHIEVKASEENVQKKVR